MVSQPTFAGDFRPRSFDVHWAKSLPSLPAGCAACANHGACCRRRPEVEEQTVNVLLGGRPLFCSEI